jgi:hypothetical protein
VGGGVQPAEISQITLVDWAQPLSKPEDWWLIVLGLGLRWTVDQMGPVAAAHVRETTVEWLRTNNVSSIQTNVIYVVATKDTAKGTSNAV